MSDSLEVRKTVEVKGEKVSFTRLTIRDVLPLAQAIKAENESVQKQLIDECKLSAYEKYNVLSQLRTSKPTVADVFEYAHTPQGTVEVLRKSLAKGGVDSAKHDAVIDAMPLTEAVELAKELILDQPIPKPPVADGTKDGGGDFLSPPAVGSASSPSPA